MESATKNRRGRPRIYTDVLYSIYNDKEKRVAQNMYYVAQAIILLGEKPGGFFVTEKGNIRRQGIAEQIGRMHKQDGYSDEDCIEVYKTAMELYAQGFSVKAIEKMIRHGRTTGEW